MKKYVLLFKKASTDPNWKFFLLGLAMAIIFSPGNLFIDTEKRLQVTRWIWTDEPQVLESDSQYLNHLPGKNGNKMAQFGLGQSLIMVPADMLSSILLGKDLNSSKSKIREMIVYYFTFPIITGFALMFVRKIVGNYLSEIKIADFVTLSIAFCSSFFIYAKDTQENMLMNLCVFAGIWHGLLWGKHGSYRHAALLGIFFGYLMLIRISTIAVIAPFCAVFLIFFLRNSSSRWCKKYIMSLCTVVGVLILFVLLERFYHWHRFGEITKTYADYMIEQAKLHGHEDNYPMGYPMASGLYGFFIDIRKSVFLFDPIIVFSVLVLFIKNKANNSSNIMLTAGFSSLIFTALLYSKSDFWHGDTSWGPRHLHIAIMPVVMFGLIGFVNCMRFYSSRFITTTFKISLLLGALVQLLSLPLYNDLEIDQWKAGYKPYFPPVLRVMNLVARMKGDPYLWKLDCGSERILELQKLPIQFLPFQISSKLPNSIIGNVLSYSLIIIWLTILIFFLYWVVVWTKCSWSSTKPIRVIDARG